MDHLEKLRAATMAGALPRADGADLVFADGTRVPALAPTAFHPGRAGLAPYSVGALAFLLRHAGRKFIDYRKQAAEAGVPHVAVTDRKAALGFVFWVHRRLCAACSH